MSLQAQSPTEFLKTIVGQPVIVKLNSGVDYRGTNLPVSSTRTLAHALIILANTDLGVLTCLDGYMNIALEQTEEYVNGQVQPQLKSHWSPSHCLSSSRSTAMPSFAATMVSAPHITPRHLFSCGPAVPIVYRSPSSLSPVLYICAS